MPLIDQTIVSLFRCVAHLNKNSSFTYQPKLNNIVSGSITIELRVNPPGRERSNGAC